MFNLFGRFRNVAVAALAVSLLLAAGCAAPATRYPVMQADSFFRGEFPDFKPGPEGGVDFVEMKEGVDYKKYKLIMIDPISFRLNANEYVRIDEQTFNDLRNAFHKAFVDALGDAYPVVDKPRPDALLVRIIIVGIAPSIPSASSSDKLPVSVGGASIMAEILDSWTNQRVSAVIDTKKGNKRSAVKDGDEWGHTRDVFNFWAQRLRKWLDDIHGR